ncbi:hypothetical protein BBJ28_00001228 [Nothophytophthora sp. Chile5]|nr:hypothetical protein BBJ28_00001228 [Nothophytophthora sp. Chile5]
MSSPPPAKKARVMNNGGAAASSRDVCIVGVARTPCGSLQGKLAVLGASELAGIVIKAVMFGAQAIMLGLRDVVVVGGMESMSQAPHLSKKARGGARFGDLVFSDALQTDGLFDAYENIPMGDLAEECARKLDVSREAQDAYAAESYRRAREATNNGKFKREVVNVQVSAAKRGAAPQFVTEDEEVVARAVDITSLSKLRSCFQPSEDFGPTVTAGNASPISDGAAALVLMSREKAVALGLTANIQAVVRGFGDAEQEPRSFTTSPALAIPKALANAGIKHDAVDFFEINEAFAVVACANMKLLKLDAAKVNVYGGTSSLLRIMCFGRSLEGGRIGCAAVCNGGGGASAVVIEKM